MRAGKLTKSVIIQSPTGDRDAVGERTTTWTNVATVWASIDPLSAREIFAAAQAQSEVTQKVMIRYDSSISAITNAWRVAYGSRYLVVEGVRNIDEKNEMYELMCSEGLKVE